MEARDYLKQPDDRWKDAVAEQFKWYVEKIFPSEDGRRLLINEYRIEQNGLSRFIASVGRHSDPDIEVIRQDGYIRGVRIYGIYLSHIHEIINLRRVGYPKGFHLPINEKVLLENRGQMAAIYARPVFRKMQKALLCKK